MFKHVKLCLLDFLLQAFPILDARIRDEDFEDDLDYQSLNWRNMEESNSRKAKDETLSGKNSENDSLINGSEDQIHETRSAPSVRTDPSREYEASSMGETEKVANKPTSDFRTLQKQMDPALKWTMNLMNPINYNHNQESKLSQTQSQIYTPTKNGGRRGKADTRTNVDNNHHSGTKDAKWKADHNGDKRNSRRRRHGESNDQASLRRTARATARHLYGKTAHLRRVFSTRKSVSTSRKAPYPKTKRG